MGSSRRAFTLIELLVGMGLMLLMAVLFSSIFQIATNAMAIQKGRAENDQRVRLVVSILRTDLNGQSRDSDTGAKRQQRTFLVLIPWAADEVSGLRPINPWTPGQPVDDSDRSGYFYISENDPDDDTDDILQLTVQIDPGMSERFFGRAQSLLPDAKGEFGSAPSPGVPPFPSFGAPAANYWPNQPEFDDIYGTPNQTGGSRLAEVCYFLRAGTLYRRLLLIREPAGLDSSILTDDHSPADDAGQRLSLAVYGPSGARNFWTDFDYSGHFDGSSAQFHGRKDLGPSGPVITCLTNPAFRFGHDNSSAQGAGYGLPREFVDKYFVGRFTHAETSDGMFGYPGRIPITGNPMASSTALTFANGKITEFSNGTRAGEDVLMSNVIAFDVKVWDPAVSMGPDGAPGAVGIDDDFDGVIDNNNEIGSFGSDDGDWRDIGHRGLTMGANTYGFYRAFLPAFNPNQYYSDSTGALSVNNGRPTNRYDTWGSAVNIDGAPGNNSPPFRPVWAGPDGRPGKAGVDDDAINGIDDAGELGWSGTDDFAPLLAVKITIRFYDVTSNQIRDVSAVFSLRPIQ